MKQAIASKALNYNRLRFICWAKFIEPLTYLFQLTSKVILTGREGDENGAVSVLN